MKKIRKYVIATIILFSCFVGYKLLACFVPDAAVRNNVQKSINYMMDEGLYPSVYSYAEYHLYSQQMDNYSDAIFLNVVYNMGQTNKIEALACDYEGYTGEETNEVEKTYYVVNGDGRYALQSYARQWFGTAATLRILLSIFDYQQIRVLSQYAMYILLVLTVLIMEKRLGWKPALIYGIAIMTTSIDVVAASANLAGAYYCTLIGSILVMVLPQRQRVLGIYIIGACTAYFDLFSIPFLTLITCVIALLLEYSENRLLTLKDEIFYSIKVGLSWLTGYLVLWLSKWLLASIVSGTNVFKDAFEEMLKQSVNKGIDWGPTTTVEYVIESMKLCMGSIFPVNYGVMFVQKTGGVGGILILLIVLLVIGAFVRKLMKGKVEAKMFIILGLWAIIPYLLYAVMHTHAFVHFWMWYRIQVITTFCLGTMFVIKRPNFSHDLVNNRGEHNE